MRMTEGLIEFSTPEDARKARDLIEAAVADLKQNQKDFTAAVIAKTISLQAAIDGIPAQIQVLVLTEREACAKISESCSGGMTGPYDPQLSDFVNGYREARRHIAVTIRARLLALEVKPV